jgi:YHS domain-containing protein
MVKDPVCGMKVDEFCCPGCQQRFDQNPPRYVRQSAE